MTEDEPEQELVLCDQCSAATTSPDNWLGVTKLDQPFDCVICMRLLCKHLRGPGGSLCLDCET